MNLILADARHLPFPDEAFDAVLMSGVLHEIKSVAGDSGAELALSEAARTLASGGKLLVRDFLDPGNGLVTAQIQDALPALREFSRKFKVRKIEWQELGLGQVRISRRDLQDFASKANSLGKPEEEFEMRETYSFWTYSQIVKFSGNENADHQI